MFSRIFGGKSNKDTSEDKDKNLNVTKSINDIQIPTESTETVKSDVQVRDFDLNLKVNLVGSKGWPSNVTVVIYHKNQGLIIAGTDNGTIYVYGDGFQYVRTPTNLGNNQIVNLTPIKGNKILVAYGNNTISVLEIPSLNIVCTLNSSWLGANAGDITVIHYDESISNEYFFVGTSTGYLFVLQICDTLIRECEYFIKSSDNGTNLNFAVSDIKISPKVII